MKRWQRPRLRAGQACSVAARSLGLRLKRVYFPNRGFQTGQLAAFSRPKEACFSRILQPQRGKREKNQTPEEESSRDSN